MEAWLIALLISAGVGLVVGLYVAIDEQFLGGGFFAFIFVTPVTFLVLLLLSSFMYMFSIGHTEIYSEDTKQLQAITTSSEIEGSVYLLGGYFSEEPVYRYFTGSSDGGYVLESVDADMSVVYESDDVPPHIVIVYRTENTFFNIIGPQTYTDHIEIYVPVGSVVSDYTLEP